MASSSAISCATASRKCFFFQAEDGIRDRTVTGVQTCALPIYGIPYFVEFFFFQSEDGIRVGHVTGVQTCALPISFVEFVPKRRKRAILGEARHRELSGSGN